MSKKIGVRKAMQMDTKGNMSYVMDVGGKGGGSRGPTNREKFGSALGGTVGVLGALTGSHRSLGGVAGSMYAGGMQGSAAGRGLAGKTVSRERRARAKLTEDERQDDAQLAAQRQQRMGRVEAGGSYNPMRVGANLKDDESRLDDVGSGGRNPNFAGFRSKTRAKSMADLERAHLTEMGQQLADRKLDEQMGMKDFRQFRQKHGDLMADANTRPEAMAAITRLIGFSPASLEASVNVSGRENNGQVLPVQMSGPEGATTQIADKDANHYAELGGMAGATGAPPQNAGQPQNADTLFQDMLAQHEEQKQIQEALQTGSPPGM